jgi:hypothetical protein
VERRREGRIKGGRGQKGGRGGRNMNVICRAVGKTMLSRQAGRRNQEHDVFWRFCVRWIEKGGKNTFVCFII